MKFYGERFDLGPGTLFGVRYNRLMYDKYCSPYMNDGEVWKPQKASVSDDKGIFAVPVCMRGGHGCKAMFNHFLESLDMFLLMEYSEKDINRHFKKDNKKELSYGEVAVYRANIIQASRYIEEFPLVAYNYCQEKQLILSGTKQNYEAATNYDFCPHLERICVLAAKTSLSQMYGIDHARRVEAYGVILAQNNSIIDVNVVRAFAYLKDCCRLGDDDYYVGQDSARFIGNLRHTLLNYLDDREFDLLKQAIYLQSLHIPTGDATIDACIDAAHLDTGGADAENIFEVRSKMCHDPNLMVSEVGKMKAMCGLTQDEECVFKIVSGYWNRVAYYLENIQNWHNSIMNK